MTVNDEGESENLLPSHFKEASTQITNQQQSTDKCNTQDDTQFHIDIDSSDSLRSKKWKNKVSSILCLIGCLILSVVMFTLGYIHINDCPKQTYIPTFLIAGGVLTTLCSISMFYNRVRRFDVHHPVNRMTVALNNILNGFTFTWYMMGCVLVYGAYKPVFEVVFDSDAQEYCNRELYLFCFWMLNAIFISFASCILVATLIFLLGIINNFTKNSG